MRHGQGYEKQQHTGSDMRTITVRISTQGKKGKYQSKGLKNVAKELGLNLKSRPSELSIDDYFKLAEFYEKLNYDSLTI